LQIREATIEDQNLITDYTLQLHHHESDISVEPHPNFENNLSAWILSELSNSQSLFLIATIDNLPIGFIGASSQINDNGFVKNPIKGIIQLLWVEPAYRQQHVAEQLLTNIDACFVELGIKYIECSFTATNTLAENFWMNNGYKITSLTARKIIM